jgi:hypothetical protein
MQNVKLMIWILKELSLGNYQKAHKLNKALYNMLKRKLTYSWSKLTKLDAED